MQICTKKNLIDKIIKLYLHENYDQKGAPDMVAHGIVDLEGEDTTFN